MGYSVLRVCRLHEIKSKTILVTSYTEIIGIPMEFSFEKLKSE